MTAEIQISGTSLLDIGLRARSNPTEEVCGAILRGEHIPIDNVVKPDQRHRRFKMDPGQQMKVWEKWAREGDLIIYHSHPKGTATPSDEDKWVMSRSPDITFLIFAVTTGWFKAYRYSEAALGIVEVKITSVTGSTQPDQPGTVTSGPTS